MSETLTDMVSTTSPAPGVSRLVLVAIGTANDGALTRPSAESLTLARGLADTHGWPLMTVTATAPTAVTLADLRRHGVGGVHVLGHPQLDADAAP